MLYGVGWGLGSSRRGGVGGYSAPAQVLFSQIVEIIGYLQKVTGRKVIRMWTDDEVAQLREMAAAGFMVAVMGRRLGRTGRSISGKCDKLGISLRKNSFQAEAPKNCDRLPLKITVREIQPRLPVSPDTLAAVAALSAGECRWPIGDPPEPGFHFCGERAADGSPYCATHEARRFVPGSARFFKEKEIDKLIASVERRAATPFAESDA